jgi:hypothetical protein
MADIDVQRRSGPSWWAWLLALAALAVLLWLVLAWLGDDDEAEVAAVDPAAAPVVIPVDTGMPAAGTERAAAAGAVPAVVESYMGACTGAEGGEPADMGREHQFTVGCFRDLRAAIDTVMVQDQVTGVDVQSRLSDYQAAVQRLEQSQASSTEHAGYTRQAADAASALLSGMLTTGYGGQQEVTIAVGEVEAATRAIQPGTAMVQQREAVRNFFREAGEALRLMAERSASAAASA